MKKLLLILLCLPLLFTTCKKEDDNQPTGNTTTSNTSTGTTGYLCQYGTVYKTTDSGVSWTTQGGAGGNQNFSISFF